MLYALRILESKTKKKHVPYLSYLPKSVKHDWFLFLQFSLPQKLIMDCFTFSKAALNFYKWYQYNEKIQCCWHFLYFFFFLLNISIRGNPIKMCCFEVLKINRCSGVTQIVRSLWKRRGENCFCLTSMTFLFFSFIFLLELQTKCSSL